MLTEKQLKYIKDIGTCTLFEEFKQMLRDGKDVWDDDYLIVNEEVFRRMVNGYKYEMDLSKFKSEIENEKEPYEQMWETGFDDVSYGKYRAYRKCLGIIDNYIAKLNGE